MRHSSFMVIAVSAAITLGGVSAFAQAQAPAPYGAPITLEQAKKIAAAAEAEARKNNLNSLIVIVEPNGQPVYVQKMDGTQYASFNVAMDKATSSALYRRPTTAFEAGLKAGNLYLMTLRGMNAVPGGLPIVVDGKLVGGIGVSGGSGAEDVQVAQAGIAGLK